MREGWEYKKLGEVATQINGFAFRSSLFKEIGKPIVRISNIQNDIITSDFVFFDQKDYKENLDKYEVHFGDVLIAMSGATTGKVGINKNKETLYLNQRVGNIVPKKNLLSIFLFYYLKHNSKFSLSVAQGLAQPNLSSQQINDFIIPIPPLSEQQRIVEELDLLSGIIEKKKAQLKELDSLAQSIFYDMFGDPVTNEKGWEVKKLGEECKDIKYGTSRPASENGKYKYIRMGNITINGSLDLSDLKKISIPDEEIEKCIVRYGDILFNRTNSLDLIGKTCMFDLKEPMVIAGYIIRVRLSNNLDPRYISIMFNLPQMKLRLKKMAKGAVNQANINSKELASIPVPLPPLPLQQQFAEKIEAIEQQKELIKQSIKEVETLFNSRMDYYFDG